MLHIHRILMANFSSLNLNLSFCVFFWEVFNPLLMKQIFSKIIWALFSLFNHEFCNLKLFLEWLFIKDEFIVSNFSLSCCSPFYLNFLTGFLWQKCLYDSHSDFFYNRIMDNKICSSSERCCEQSDTFLSCGHFNVIVSLELIGFLSDNLKSKFRCILASKLFEFFFSFKKYEHSCLFIQIWLNYLRNCLELKGFIFLYFDRSFNFTWVTINWRSKRFLGNFVPIQYLLLKFAQRFKSSSHSKYHIKFSYHLSIRKFSTS